MITSTAIRLCLGSALIAATALPVSAQENSVGTPDLGRQQYIAQMDAEFAGLDVDGNGIVSAEEITATQRRAAQAEALRQNQAVFAQLDADGDGTLAPQEFAQLANPGAIPTDPAPLLQRFDTNGDGTITLVEYRIATQASFDGIDTDRDGVVTAVEMRAAGIVQ